MSGADTVQLILFTLGNRTFAFGILSVERVLAFVPPVSLPGAPAFVEGVLRDQDRVVPVLDLRKRFGLRAPTRDDLRLLLVEGAPPLALIVDTVPRVVQVPAAEVRAGAGAPGVPAEAVVGAVTRPGGEILVLSPSKLLSPAEHRQLELVLLETAHE